MQNRSFGDKGEINVRITAVAQCTVIDNHEASIDLRELTDAAFLRDRLQT